MIFKSVDSLQFLHYYKSYLQNGYFFCVDVVAKKKLLVIRIFLNKQQNYLFFSLLQGNLFRFKKKRNRHDWNIVETGILNTIKRTNKNKNGENVRFIKRNYEILYKEISQWHDTDQEKKPHWIRATMFNFQFLDSIWLRSKLQKVQI